MSTENTQETLFNNMNTHWNANMAALREEHRVQLLALQQTCKNYGRVQE